MRDAIAKHTWHVVLVAVLCSIAALSVDGWSQPATAQVQDLVLDRAKSNVIHRVSQDFLGRPATADELDHYLPRLGVSQDENDVQARFLAGTAFFDLAGGDRSGFINAAYQEALGRAPTTTEFNNAFNKIGSSDLIPRLARRTLADELLERAAYDPDGLGVREVVLDIDEDGKITRFHFELDRTFAPDDRTALSVSINGRELSGEVRSRAGLNAIRFIPDKPVKQLGPIIALAFVNQDGTTRLADVSTPSRHLPPRTIDEADVWADEVFADQRVIANYGHHTTSVLGVLGETGPDAAVERVQEVAARFDEPGRPAIGAFEMIVTVAQASPGIDGDYSSPSNVSEVAKWIDIAEAARVYVILDIQPGRSDFLTESKRYESLLLRPNVGLALDPEWRMGPTGIPGQTVGKVSAEEVNQVSLWLSDLTLENDLPEKIFMVHQFQERMISNREQVIDRPGLATVIHVDGFGSRIEKQATYSRLRVEAPFYNGFKLFIDEDRGLYQPHEVLAFSENPVPDFVSYQ